MDEFMQGSRKRQRISQRVGRTNQDSMIHELNEGGGMMPKPTTRKGGDKYIKARGESPLRIVKS